MDNVKNDTFYIERIRSDLAHITRHMKKVDYDSLDCHVQTPESYCP